MNDMKIHLIYDMISTIFAVMYSYIVIGDQRGTIINTRTWIYEISNWKVLLSESPKNVRVSGRIRVILTLFYCWLCWISYLSLVSLIYDIQDRRYMIQVIKNRVTSSTLCSHNTSQELISKGFWNISSAK